MSTELRRRCWIVEPGLPPEYTGPRVSPPLAVWEGPDSEAILRAYEEGGWRILGPYESPRPVKTEAQQIRDAAAVIVGELTGGYEQRTQRALEIAQRALQAANRQRPAWPTRDSIDRFKAAYRSCMNIDWPSGDEWAADCLREAMVDDPIIEAATDLREVYAQGLDGALQRDEALKRLFQAVDEVGL